MLLEGVCPTPCFLVDSLKSIPSPPCPFSLHSCVDAVQQLIHLQVIHGVLNIMDMSSIIGVATFFVFCNVCVVLRDWYCILYCYLISRSTSKLVTLIDNVTSCCIEGRNGNVMLEGVGEKLIGLDHAVYAKVLE